MSDEAKIPIKIEGIEKAKKDIASIGEAIRKSAKQAKIQVDKDLSQAITDSYTTSANKALGTLGALGNGVGSAYGYTGSLDAAQTQLGRNIANSGGTLGESAGQAIGTVIGGPLGGVVGGKLGKLAGEVIGGALNAEIDQTEIPRQATVNSVGNAVGTAAAYGINLRDETMSEAFMYVYAFEKRRFQANQRFNNMSYNLAK